MEVKSSNKKVISNSLVYTISGLLIKCFGFFLLPLYTAYLSTDEYGITSLSTSFLSTMSFIVALSLYSAVLRFFVDYKNDEKKLRRLYGTIIVFTFISGLFWLIILTVFKDLISKYFFSGIDFYPIVFVCVISLVFYCQQAIYENILKSQQKALKCSVLSIVYFLATVFMNILFVVKFNMGAYGVVLSTMIASGLYTLYFIFDMIIGRHIIFCLDFKILKDALKYSIPIMPHNLSTQIAVFVSKILIGEKTSLAALGIYSVASQFGNISDTIQTYVDQAYGPWLYEKLHDHEEGFRQSIRNVVKLLISAIGFMLVGIALFSQDYIVLFLDKSYVESWKYVPLIVMVFAIKTMYYFYVEVLFYYKKASKFLFIATLSSSLLNVLLSCIFIPQYGVMGSILADAIAMILRVCIIVLISLKFENLGLYIRDFIINIIVIALLITVGLFPSLLKPDFSFGYMNLAYKVLIMLFYLFIIYIKNKKMILPTLEHIMNRHKKS